ncbi:DUF4340 domain-containing protein [bacterium]|nr:DUF4340 domain-containing protein [bacterium]
MKSRSTLILVVCALVVAGLVWWDFRQGTTTDQAEQNRRRLVDLDGSTVDRVELERSNQTIVAEKRDGRWELTQPIAARADVAAVNALVNELEFAQRDRTFTADELEGVNLVDLGLVEPRLRLTLTARQRSVTLLVGTNTPTGEAVYVQVADHPEVFVVEQGVADRLDRSLDELRDRLVFDLRPAAITRVELKAVDRVLELVRPAATTNGAPGWMLVQPLAARADTERVQTLLQALAGLRVQQFISDDPQAAQTYALREPAREVSVRQGDDDPGTTLLLGRPLTNDATRVYAKRRGDQAVFTLDDGAVQRLDLSASDLRDRRVLLFAPDRVRTVELTRGADMLVIERAGDAASPDWQLTVPLDIPADLIRVEDFLRDLQDLRATQFVENVATDLERFGLALPTLIVTLKGAGTNVLAQLLVGALDATNQVRYARNAAEPSFIYGLVEADVARLPAKAGDLRTRQVAALPAAEIRQLAIQQGQQETVLERGSDDKWRLVVPAQGVLNHDRLDDLLRELGDLRAEEFLTATPDQIAAARQGQPGLAIRATTVGKPSTLLIGQERDDGQTIASWAEPLTVFTLSPIVVDVLRAPLVTAPAPPATNAVPATAAPAAE